MSKILIGVVVLILAIISVKLYSDTDDKSGVKSSDSSEQTVKLKEAVVVEDKGSIEGDVVADKGNSLDLSGQNLTKAPAYIFEQANLEELNLSNNKIEGSLQAEVRLLQKLRVLDLSNNNFTGLPAEVGQLANLEILNLANNKLTGLPMELGNLKNIKQIDLRGNAYSVPDLNSIKAKLGSGVKILVD